MIPASENAVRRILIAGNGFEAWLTAGLLARELGGKEIEIAVCEVPGSEAWDALYSLLPLFPEDGVHKLGLSDLQLVQKFDASFSMGARIRRNDDGTLLPYGPVGIDYAGVAFHHYWRLAGSAVASGDYFQYSPGVRAMQAGTFAPPVRENAIGSLQHEVARHVLPAPLTIALKKAALTAGAAEVRAPLADVRRTADGRRIESVTTTAGDRIVSDLYIDCSGPSRRLIGTATNESWIAADHASPYRLTAEYRESPETPPPMHEVTVSEEGWRIAIPLQSKRIDLEFLEIKRNEIADFTSGYSSRPWSGNCVGLGHTTCRLLPILPFHTRLLMTNIARLIDLLPGPDNFPAETMEFNQLFACDAEQAHDWVAIHELARKYDTLEAATLHDVVKRDPLMQRLTLFKKRGWIPPSDSDLVAAHDWSSSLMLHGLVPDHHDLLAERIPVNTLPENLGQLAAHIDQVVGDFPPHGIYLRAICATRAASRETRSTAGTR